MLIPILQPNKNYAATKEASDTLLASIVRGEDNQLLWEDMINAAKNATDRVCGGCNMCCYALTIEEPLNKPAGDMCKNCDVGVGCKIYEERPTVCSRYYCSWLTDDFFGPEWWPAESKIIVQRRESKSRSTYYFIVDENYKDRWKEEPYFSTIKRVSVIGLNDQSFQTYVSHSGGLFLILPTEYVDVSEYAHTIVRTGPTRDDWGVNLLKDDDEVRRFNAGRRLVMDMMKVSTTVAQRVHSALTAA